MSQTNAKPTSQNATSAASDAKILVVDIGKKQKKKRIKKLRKGRGPLFDRVRDVVEGLREEGTIDAKSTPIVIVVREKSSGLGGFRW